MTYRELDKFYNENYSLGNLNLPSDKDESSFEKKLILISLICYITYKTSLKNPDITHYQIVKKLSDKLGLPDDFLIGLSIVCKDFSYNSTEFPTFGLKGQDIIKKVRTILNSYMPF